MISKRSLILLGLLFLDSSFGLRLGAEWQRTDTTLAWIVHGQPVWRFSFDPAKGKVFFHPVTVAGGPSLTNFRPEDHPWHYALWFSWKYINHVNYWEENKQTGQSAGKTTWTVPEIEARDDGSATIKLALSYTNPTGRVDVTEQRVLTVSASAADGSYAIDWTMDFTAGPEGALLDRTPMPGEPKGQVNGGYAGLSARLAHAPLSVAYVTPEGPVTEFASNRARPAAAAVGCNFTDAAGKNVGGLAIFSAPANAGTQAPWYLINSPEMHFACAALLAPQPRHLAAGEKLNLRYRVALRPSAWTPESLRSDLTGWANSEDKKHPNG